MGQLTSASDLECILVPWTQIGIYCHFYRQRNLKKGGDIWRLRVNKNVSMRISFAKNSQKVLIDRRLSPDPSLDRKCLTLGRSASNHNNYSNSRHHNIVRGESCGHPSSIFRSRNRSISWRWSARPTTQILFQWQRLATIRRQRGTTTLRCFGFEGGTIIRWAELSWAELVIVTWW